MHETHGGQGKPLVALAQSKTSHRVPKDDHSTHVDNPSARSDVHVRRARPRMGLKEEMAESGGRGVEA